MGKEKRRIKVELYNHDQVENAISEIEYEGRLLGLMNDQQFSSLLRHKSLQSKFLNIETMKLDSITDNYKEMNGLRLVVAIKKKNNKWAEKNLFVSEKLSCCAYTSYHGNNEHQAGFNGKNNGWILVTEEVVE